MQCLECKKLKMECALTALEHRELLRLREANARPSPPNGPEIWDFILDIANKKSGDAERALAAHRTRHISILPRPASILTAVLGQIDIFEAAISVGP